jgi:hypothetical protein
MWLIQSCVVVFVPKPRKRENQRINKHYTFNTYATQNGRLQENKKLANEVLAIPNIIYAKIRLYWLL